MWEVTILRRIGCGASARINILARLACLGLVAFMLTSAQASASTLPFTGTILFQVSALGAVALPGSGTGDPTLPSISASAFVGTASLPVSANPPVTQLFFSGTGNAAGMVGTGPTIGGNLQVRGFGIGAAIAKVPLGTTHIGSAVGPRLGFPSATAMLHSAASATVSAHFGQWTQGVANVARVHTGMTRACVPGGVTCPTGMLGGATANLAFFGGGAQIVLVAPIDLWSSLAQGLPTFGVMALNYVPEPGTLLLLSSGVIGLAVIGRRRLHG